MYVYTLLCQIYQWCILINGYSVRQNCNGPRQFNGYLTLSIRIGFFVYALFYYWDVEISFTAHVDTRLVSWTYILCMDEACEYVGNEIIFMYKLNNSYRYKRIPIIFDLLLDPSTIRRKKCFIFFLYLGIISEHYRSHLINCWLS